MTLKHLFSFDSLRSRHLFATGMLAIFLLAGIFLAHYTVEQSKNTVTANLQERNQILHLSHQIHEALMNAYSEIDVFLLEPHKNDSFNIIKESINRANTITIQLIENNWVIENANSINLGKLPGHLQEFSTEIELLVATRRDSLQQFPSLAVSNREMRPFRDEFNNAMAVAIYESSEITDISKVEGYRTLVEARHLWTQMVSNYRLYLANQLGSFDEESLPVQEQSIEIMYIGLQSALVKLTKMDSENKFDFETSNALQQLADSASAWFTGFEKVRKIHQGDNWRADKRIIENSIKPKLNLIWDILFAFDKKMEEAAKNDVILLSQTAFEQENVLWGIAALIFTFIGVGFFYAERVIFSPISMIANALRDEAAGRSVDVLPSITSKEIRDLVDAFTDMQYQVRSRQLALEHRTLHDDLTGLPNRTLLFDRVNQAILSTQKSGCLSAVLVIDINNLKEINDTLGHHVGDRFLVETSMRIRKMTSNLQTVSRLGGNEFAILLTDISRKESAMFADKLLQQLKRQLQFDEVVVHPRFNIGIAMYPLHGIDANVLVQRADIAMTASKKMHQEVLIYAESYEDFSVTRLAMISDLKNAISNDLLEMHYQPKFNITDQTVVGVEALLRWKHSLFGWIQPSQIIPIAEQSKMIVPLTHWTIKSAIKQCAEWKKIGIELNVAINLSVHVLYDDNFIDFVKQELEQCELRAKYITFEITESAMMRDPAKASEILNKLNEIGVSISVDDFGTGFSSLSYLKQLPVNEIKIDKSFVLDMVRDSTDEAIVISTIGLAHNLGLKVVAEGIETQDTQDMLVNMSCDIGQGFYFSKPLKADFFIRWLMSRNETEQYTE